MVLLSRVGNILGASPSAKRARWWPVGLLAISAVLMSILSFTGNEIRAEEASGDEDQWACAPRTLLWAVDHQEDLPGAVGCCVHRRRRRRAPPAAPCERGHDDDDDGFHVQ